MLKAFFKIISNVKCKNTFFFWQKKKKRGAQQVLTNQFSHTAYLPTFKFQKEEQMREKNLKRGTFLNFLYITIQRLLQKQEHMIKSFSFLLRKEELFLQKRNSWQVCILNCCWFLSTWIAPNTYSDWRLKNKTITRKLTHKINIYSCTNLQNSTTEYRKRAILPSVWWEASIKCKLNSLCYLIFNCYFSC